MEWIKNDKLIILLTENEEQSTFCSNYWNSNVKEVHNYDDLQIVCGFLMYFFAQLQSMLLFSKNYINNNPKKWNLNNIRFTVTNGFNTIQKLLKYHFNFNDIKNTKSFKITSIQEFDSICDGIIQFLYNTIRLNYFNKYKFNENIQNISIIYSKIPELSNYVSNLNKPIDFLLLDD